MLSNNLLGHLPDNFGEKLLSLELLRLANNQFHHFPRTLYAAPNLTWLSLAGNPCSGGPVTIHQLPPAARINLDTEYTLHWENPLGAGTSSTAFLGVHRKSGSHVAVKRFKGIRGSDGRALDEVGITLAAAGVEGVVKALGYCLIESEETENQLILVTELVKGKSYTIADPPSFDTCTRSVYPKDLNLTKTEAMYVIAVVERAVYGLLGRGIAHGDVYGHNILVAKHDNGDAVAALGDLGAAWRFSDKEREFVSKLETRALTVFREEVIALAR